MVHVLWHPLAILFDLSRKTLSLLVKSLSLAGGSLIECRSFFSQHSFQPSINPIHHLLHRPPDWTSPCRLPNYIGLAHVVLHKNIVSLHKFIDRTIVYPITERKLCQLWSFGRCLKPLKCIVFQWPCQYSCCHQKHFIANTMKERHTIKDNANHF